MGTELDSIVAMVDPTGDADPPVPTVAVLASDETVPDAEGGAEATAVADAEENAEKKVEEDTGDDVEAEVVDADYTEEELAALEDEYRWDWGWVPWHHMCFLHLIIHFVFIIHFVSAGVEIFCLGLH